ncbi:hypothetical protein AV530_018674 [Patagioenas fasciata monilis]|uniref:Uncharacterized protein n=1 Tax=Patagioenas fasciata monilis TaxID=372326 RepID=A0A1V4JJE6_PATFA|nr:hypothetical protein AV530_018674 [Patagioenas fasciata monilis]
MYTPQPPQSFRGRSNKLPCLGLPSNAAPNHHGLKLSASSRAELPLFQGLCVNAQLRVETCTADRRHQSPARFLLLRF